MQQACPPRREVQNMRQKRVGLLSRDLVRCNGIFHKSLVFYVTMTSTQPQIVRQHSPLRFMCATRSAVGTLF